MYSIIAAILNSPDCTEKSLSDYSKCVIEGYNEAMQLFNIEQPFLVATIRLSLLYYTPCALQYVNNQEVNVASLKKQY